MWVYVGASVANSENKHHRQRIKQIQEQIETGDPLLFSLLFSPRYPHWIKRIQRDWRLLATVKVVDQETVLCLTHLLSRSSHDYAEFLADPAAWGQQKMQVPEAQLQTWLQQRQQIQPPPPLLTIDHLSPWLEKPNLFRQQDRVIFESEVWVERWRDREMAFSHQWQSFHKILAHLLTIQESNCRAIDEHRPIQSVVQEYHLQGYWDPETDCTILYRTLHPQDRSKRQIIFLLAPFQHLPTGGEITLLGKDLEMYGSTVDRNILTQPITADEIAQFARRSYPDYLVYEPHIWHSLEQDQEANLALSGEEEELLDRIRFPAFINGRAGSGKSTMLYHAFAYYCDLYLQAQHAEPQPSSSPASTPEMLPPLFLTYSKSLTDRASQAVKNILTSHVCYQENLQQGQRTLPHLTDSSLSQLEDCFRPFQSFLREQLPAPIAAQFTSRTYISLHRFKQLYSRSFPHHKYSPEMCWHAIRTYIKGFYFTEDGEEYLTAEEYVNEIEQAYKSIDDEVFTAIYREIWRWYRDLQHEAGYWDDQDLVRAVLRSIVQPERAPQNYAAIFCDEAQDFTRLELQVILRLSIWSHCRLYPPVHNLPFAFAGDPMQTLNPTGFDWESLRASFYDRILIPLDPAGELRLRDQDLTELEELQQNYRSTREIVRFSNVVHLWRKALFNLKALKPQIPWRDKKHGIPPQKGIIAENLVKSELEQIAKSNIIFILPCDEGGEVDFLHRSPELRQLFPDLDRKNERPLNVYSAIAFKGMEFSQIIVCGFGEYFAQEFGDRPLEFFLEHPAKTLKLEYFLNKLYVAVSRSTQLLGIIDTPLGDRVLWQSAQNHCLDRWLHLLSSEELSSWRSQVQSLSLYFNITIFQQTQPLELAEIFLQSGLDQQSADFFETAAFYYDRAQCPAEADYCRAWLLRLQERWREAGEQFMQIHFSSKRGLRPAQDAWDCFWAGQHWDALLNWCDHYSTDPLAEWRGIIVFMVATMLIEPAKESIGISSSELLDSKPLDSKPLDSKPLDSKPLDSKPLDSKLLDSKPLAIQTNLKEITTVDATVGNRWTARIANLQMLTESLDEGRIQQLLQPGNDRIWQPVWPRLRAEMENLLMMPPQQLAASQWRSWQQMLSRLAESGLIAEGCQDLAARCAYRATDYALAVTVWEAIGEPIDRTDPEYCVAKAALLPAPEKFIWLHRSQQWDHVVAEWQQGNYQINEAWQPVLAGLRQALSQQGQMIALLELEMQLGQWVTVVQQLMDRVAAQDPAFDAQLQLRMLQRMAADTRLTPATIQQEVEQIVERQSEPIGKQEQENIDVSRSGNERPQRTLERMRREKFLEARRLLCRFVDETTRLEEWVADSIHLQEAGVVFDRIGELVPALRFYERFRTGFSLEICELARERWIEVKRRQARRSEQMGNLNLAQKQRQDIETIGQTWRCLPPQPSALAFDLRQSLVDRLVTWPEAELSQITEYLDFLEFRRRSGD